uniref:Transducin family protein / WD-40 repeat family protein n=1 Tax=Zea mays TaxID=4577 RepID=A0A804RKH0_MAIZE
MAWTAAATVCWRLLRLPFAPLPSLVPGLVFLAQRPDAVDKEYADLNLRPLYPNVCRHPSSLRPYPGAIPILPLIHLCTQRGHHIRVRQHMNPLSSSFSEPTGPPEWKEVFDDPLLPLMVDIGCGNLDVQGVGVGMMSTFFPLSSRGNNGWIVIKVQVFSSEAWYETSSKIIATHTDSPDVLIWDVEAQPNRHAVLGASESRPDLEIVEFALAMCPAEPYVLSEGKDKSVVLWSIQDHISALGDSSSSPGASDSKQSVKTTNEKESPKVDPRGIFHGHDSRVEDVQFYPSRSFVVWVMMLVLFCGMLELALLQLLRLRKLTVEMFIVLIGIP